MVSLDDAVVARLERGGEKFEILVDPDLAQDYREDPANEPDFNELLVIEDVFKDAHKGDRASEESIDKIFETQDMHAIVKVIILDGDIHLTTEQRKKMVEQKTKQIITKIAQNAINPQTSLPHPPARIEIAMEEAKVHIDPFKPVDLQVQEVLKEIQTVLPIRFEKITVALKVAGTDQGRIYGDCKEFGRILKEEWTSDGQWIALVEIPAGVQLDFFDRLNAKTKGNIETKILK